jgi:sterol desaturase/sphingolipid hydroxylase (fatty acid hydroxylase superfamily)
LRAWYPMPFIRGLIQGGLVVSVVLGAVSLALPGQRIRGLCALVLCGGAFALGGGYAQPVEDSFDAPVIGLDFLLLDLFALCVLFVPLERMLGRRQKVMREGWQVDFTHFVISHALVGVIAALAVAPAQLLFGWLMDFEYRATVAALNPVLQFALVVLVVDFTCYWVHRAFHAIPWLWRFHAVHHSVTEMDWLAGSRQHLGDVIATRAIGFIPVFVLGFADIAIYAYILLISFHAVFIHANMRISIGPIGRVISSPKFHHWHHADAPEAIDKNFAILLPIWDTIFGTAHWTKAWPQAYGLSNQQVPTGWLGQHAYPFRRNATEERT